MTAVSNPPNIPIGPDEKSAQIMVYTRSGVCWGDVVIKEILRASTWLRTNSAPDRICLYNAKMMVMSGSQPKPISFPEFYMSVSELMAYHVMPPAQDPLDYDPNEPNRKFDPVTIVVGTFRFDGFLRLSTIANLGRFLDVTKENFTAMYNIEITNLVMPAMGVMKVPFMLVRQATSIFATRIEKA